jgi:hypothetical protein
MWEHGKIRGSKTNFDYCQKCFFKSFRKCDLEKYIIRPTHKLNKDGNVQETEKLEKTFLCDCGKIYISIPVYENRKKRVTTTMKIKKLMNIF